MNLFVNDKYLTNIYTKNCLKKVLSTCSNQTLQCKPGALHVTHLQYTHFVGVAQNFVSLLIETIPDVSHGHKHLKRIILIYLGLPRPDFCLELLHSLPSVGGKGQLFLITPENIGLFQTGLRQHVMQIHNL